MPIATLEFDLPTEAGEHQAAVDGAHWMSVVSNMQGWLNKKYKHGEVNITVDEASEMLSAIVGQQGLTL